MLRMVLLGLLIPLGVGVLAAMELKTPERSAAVAVQPAAETTAGISDSQGVLARADRLEKADRLEIAAVSSEAPAQPASADERIAPPEDIRIGASEPPKAIDRHRHDRKSKKVATAAVPKPKPKKIDIKRTASSERRKAASDSVLCRLSAFGGLRRALNSNDCEI